MKRIVIFYFATFIALIVNARNISGVILDEESKEPLIGVSVTLANDSIKTIMSTTTNGNGWFSLNNADTTIFVSINLSYVGYETQKITIELIGENDIDLGEILLAPKQNILGEVVVIADNVIEKTDKYVLIPSVAELERATESLNLLSEMTVKMPGLKVNEALEQVSVDGSSVVFLINGKEEPFEKVKMLTHKDILRIEYRNTPDVKYAERGAGGIINFIMKPRQEGGTIMAELDNAITSLRSNNSIAGTYYYKKSEWSLNYSNTWQKNTKQYTNVQENYIGENGTIYRGQIGLPSLMRDFSNYLSLGYTYMHNTNTMFSVDLSFKTKDIYNRNNSIIEELIDETSKRYEKLNPNKSKINTPALDLFFCKNFSPTQFLEINAVGTISNGDYYREMYYEYEDGTNYNQTNNTDNKSWATAIEMLYSIEFKNVSTRYGVNYNHNQTENRYSENKSTFGLYELTNDNLYFYGDIVGRWKKLGFTLGIGGKYFHIENLSKNNSSLKFKSIATLNLKINKNWSMNYLYMYSPEMPPLSSMNEEIHTIDDISIQEGNILIKPSIYQRNRLYIKYNTGDFYATAWGSYSRTDNPINSVWYYDNDESSKYYKKFINKTENGKYADNITAQLDLSYQNLFNHLTLSTSIGWDKYIVHNRHEKNILNKVFANISANAYFGNWTIYANYSIAPRYILDGQTFCRDIRYDYFGAKYRWKDFSFGIRAINAFTKKGFYQETNTPSQIKPTTTEFYIKDFSNMIELNVVYRVNFGKSYQRAGRTLQNGGVDTGINVQY